MNDKFISIIVPTYSDWGRLAQCIKSLSNQTYPPHSFEVIIVNNNPADDMPANFWLPQNHKLIMEPKPGSYAARNAALKIARGEIIGFTDSDCIPDPNWIKNAVEYFESHPSCSRIAGQISIFFKSSKPTAAELYNSLFSFPQKMHAQATGTSVTGNLFTYRLVFDKIGFFNENLLSLGDLEWGKIAHKAGYEIHYVENVIVHHPARTFTELVKKEKRVGGGQGVIGKKNLMGIFLDYLYANKLRLGLIKYIYRNGKNMGTVDKIRVLFLRQYLLSVRASEKLKVRLGKKPNRE